MAASTENMKLAAIFEKVWKSYEYLDSTDEASVSKQFQERVEEATNLCERSVHMVNDLHLFSDNENIDEVTTNEIKYLILPALLAYFTNKSVKEERYDTVNKAQTYHVDFLRLCKNYEVADITVPSISDCDTGQDQDKSATASKSKAKSNRTAPSPEELEAMNNSRQAKIQRFKQQKEMEQRLKELYPEVQKEHVDDEVKREYYITLLKRWVDTSLDELSSIESELPILEHMSKMKKSGQPQKLESKEKKDSQTKKPLRPFIITRDDVQKQVYGLGYPSIPTYSLEEFYENQVQQGQLPDQGPTRLQGGASNDPEFERLQQEKSEQEKEEKIEKDDEETLQKARDWDEWRDDHRRGWGNTHNKG